MILFTYFCFSQIIFVQDNPIGNFQYNRDIGNPEKTGAASYDERNQAYTIKGAEYNIWGQRDEHRYLYNKLEGDFILTANFESEGDNQNHRKIGWLARAFEADNAIMVGRFLHGDGLKAGQWRERKGAEMQNPDDNVWATKRFYQIIKLERRGNTFIVRAAHPGELLEEISTKNLEFMPEKVLARIVIGSHDEDVVETAKIWNLSIDQPVPEDYNPNQEGCIGCRMETMNVFDGKCKVVFEKCDRFEAPSWMPNGEKLLFNMEGSLYNIPVEEGKIEHLNTGSLERLNNDHCISFDGKLLAIGHNNGEGSNVFVLPFEGGETRLVTTKPHSYLHGWAPNNKEEFYVATRKGNYTCDIFRKQSMEKKRCS
jgi:hypothetical protein